MFVDIIFPSWSKSNLACYLRKNNIIISLQIFSEREREREMGNVKLTLDALLNTAFVKLNLPSLRFFRSSVILSISFGYSSVWKTCKETNMFQEKFIVSPFFKESLRNSEWCVNLWAGIRWIGRQWVSFQNDRFVDFGMSTKSCLGFRINKTDRWTFNSL